MVQIHLTFSAFHVLGEDTHSASRVCPNLTPTPPSSTSGFSASALQPSPHNNGGWLSPSQLVFLSLMSARLVLTQDSV